MFLFLGKGEYRLSNLMIKILFVEYVVIMITCLFEKNVPKALYWGSAGVMQIAILMGFK